MARVHAFRGAQKLKTVRAEDGQVDGQLECSVVLGLGSTNTLEFADRLTGVPVSYVLNPQHGVFLADEVQRLMRIGIGTWLQVELRRDRVVDCSCADDGWTVLFRLPLPDGHDCTLDVPVRAAADERDAVSAALAHGQSWIAALDRRPLDEDLAELLAELDLGQAPRLSCGLASIDAGGVPSAVS